MRLRYTSEAATELDGVLDGIAERSPTGAGRVRARIRAVIDQLLDRPLSGRSTALRPVRRIVARPYPYVIFYVATEDEVVILGVRHGARDPASMPDAP